MKTMLARGEVTIFIQVSVDLYVCMYLCMYACMYVTLPVRSFCDKMHSPFIDDLIALQTYFGIVYSVDNIVLVVILMSAITSKVY